MIVREFQPIDLHRINTCAPHAVAGWRGRGQKLLDAGPCWTAAQDGQVLACAGLVLHWPGRAGAWCLIGADFPRASWLWLHRQVREGLARSTDDLGLRRIEAEARSQWPQGARWLRMLGFTREGTMSAFGPDGSDFDRWSLIQPKRETA